MALIGKIRNNSALLIIVIGLGLAGFLIMDMSGASGPGGGLSQLVAGTVNGEKVRRNDFEAVKALRFSGGANRNTYQDGNTLWNWFVEDRIVKSEAEALGIGISGEEIIDLEFGPNYSPIVVQNFPSQQGIPGQPNVQLLTDFKTKMEENTFVDTYGEQMRQVWFMQRDMIKKERMQSKLQGLVTQAMYTPSWMAEMGHRNQSQTTDINYVKITYDQIANEEVAVSDSDLSSYLSANAAQYERKEEQRILDYVVFDVIPTSADSTTIRNAIAALKNDFAAAVNGDSTFVLTNDGAISPGFFSAEDDGLNGPVLRDTIAKIPVGSVYGPYSEGGEYRLVKVRSRLTMADTAEARHILLRANTADEFATANERADSMINVLRTGAAEFDSLAIKFSQDGVTARNGGKLENAIPNRSVPEGYNEYLFSTGRIGALTKIRTNIGVYVVEVLSRSASTTERMKVAFVNEPIVPSDKTITDVFKNASQFAADYRSLGDMRAATEGTNLSVLSTPAFDKNAYQLGNLGFSQETKSAICWAFGASEGEVSPETYSFSDAQRYYDNKYVVIGLKNVLPAGMPSVDDIRETLETEVLRQQKAATVASRIQGKDLNAIASEFGTQVQAAAGTTFDRIAMAGEGAEPRVVAAAAGMAQGEQSGAIEGNAGIFVIQVTNKPALAQATNLPQMRQTLTTASESWVTRSFVNLLRESAEVEDNRSTYDCQ